MRKELEDRLLSSIEQPEDLTALFNAGITDKHFVMHKEIFDFIDRYVQRYNNVPSKSVLETNFPDFKKETVPAEERKYLIDELNKNYLRDNTIKLLSRTSDLVTNDPEGALDFLLEGIGKIKRTKTLSRSYYDKDALKRFDAFLQRKNTIQDNKFIGIRTGLSVFDDTNIGWQAGNLVGIVGRTTAGKSWLLEYMAAVAYNEGKRVAFLSPEMSTMDVEMRLDTLLSSLTDGVIPNQDIIDGSANAEKYKKFLERLASRNDWLTVDSDNGESFDLHSIQNIVDDFKPDVLCIDGFLLLQTDKTAEGWLGFLDLAYGLKAIAQNNKIVVLVTAQANRKSAGDMPELTDVYGGDALAQAADVMIMIMRDDTTPNMRFITIPKVRGRKSVTSRVNIKFDVNKGIVGV